MPTDFVKPAAGEAYEWPLSDGIERRFHQKIHVAAKGECVTWLAFLNPSGYGMIRNGRRMALAHRVAWALEHGAVPDGLHVLHHCDTPACVNVEHLYLGTNADNVADKVNRGRSSYPRPDRYGELHPLAKITAVDVARIRAATGIHGEQKRIAQALGVTPSLVCRIQKHQIWKHV